MLNLRRKTPLQRVLDTVGDSLDTVTEAKPRFPDLGAGRARAGLIAAGGLVGLTAGSAAISSLRRRLDGTRGPS